jgi:hypothetical protein
MTGKLRIQKNRALFGLGLLAGDLSDPNEASNPKYFYQACYRNHAFNQIVKEVLEKDEPPRKVIEDFKERMTKAACNSLNAGYMFSVAADTADWILDTLY